MRDCNTCKYHGQCTIDDMASCAHGDNIGRSDYVPALTNADHIGSMTDEDLAKFLRLEVGEVYEKDGTKS